jgi:hypothetical protein
MSIEQYQITGKLNAFDQLNVARKLSPALPIVDGLVREENAGKDMGILVVYILSQLPDKDSAYVVEKCLSVVARKNPDGQLSKVMSSGGVLMFDDVNMKDILDITAKIIEDNLGDFLRTALPNLAQV